MWEGGLGWSSCETHPTFDYMHITRIHLVVVRECVWGGGGGGAGPALKLWTTG